MTIKKRPQTILPPKPLPTMLSGMARRGGGLFLLLLFTSLFVSACNHLPVWQNEPLPSLEATAFVPTEMPPPSVAPTQRVEMPASPITQTYPSTTVTFAPTSLPDTAPVSTSTPEMFAYTVLPGESPSSIAYKFGITVQELLAALATRQRTSADSRARRRTPIPSRARSATRPAAPRGRWTASFRSERIGNDRARRAFTPRSQT